jgi:hypothetical protein
MPHWAAQIISTPAGACTRVRLTRPAPALHKGETRPGFRTKLAIAAPAQSAAGYVNRVPDDRRR